MFSAAGRKGTREEFSLIARAGSRPADRRRARTPISEHRLRARLRSLTTRWKKELSLHRVYRSCLPQRKGRPGFNTVLLQAIFTSCYCCDPLTIPLLSRSAALQQARIVAVFIHIWGEKERGWEGKGLLRSRISGSVKQRNAGWKGQS